ncbi:hypothetical protein [Kalamiella sp. sgz302252]|uniref:hypothetical protein n=1 Tax=Pantoea sp. sgz302252 TaxID=3341827 RepID=UPI0036D370A9
MSKNVNKPDNQSPVISPSDEAWESGELGRSEAHVRVSALSHHPDFDVQINEAPELQPISIRLNKSLIEDLKMIAELSGLGYQPLIRQILTRFTDCEKKRILQEVHSAEMKKQRKKSGKKVA